MFNFENISRNSISLTYLMLITGLISQAGCVNANRSYQDEESESSESIMNEKINLKVAVAKYNINAINDDFVDGKHSSYDLTILTILEPKTYNGINLQVVHGITPSSPSFWTEVGRECIIEIDKWLLSDPEILVPREKIIMKCDID